MKAEEIGERLKNDFNIIKAKGEIHFKLNDNEILIKQKNVVGNILEEWVDNWLTQQGIPHIHNDKLESCDFWLNPENIDEDWLEIKSFIKSPNFDIGALKSYMNEIIKKPWKLHSKYLLIEYSMDDGIITIENVWIRNVWEITCSCEKWPLKVQCKDGTINNIRPSTWYSNCNAYPEFKSLEHFLSALEETIYTYHDTRSQVEKWKRDLIKAYREKFGIDLDIPRWSDIKNQYDHPVKKDE